jgi:excisionase family DNA binding protein
VDQLFSVKAAAVKLAVSPEFLKRLQRQGRLRIIRLGRSIRISEQELQRLTREEFHK